jgi:hypothetical protein
VSRLDNAHVAQVEIYLQAYGSVIWQVPMQAATRGAIAAPWPLYMAFHGFTKAYASMGVNTGQLHSLPWQGSLVCRAFPGLHATVHTAIHQQMASPRGPDPQSDKGLPHPAAVACFHEVPACLHPPPSTNSITAAAAAQQHKPACLPACHPTTACTHPT